MDLGKLLGGAVKGATSGSPLLGLGSAMFGTTPEERQQAEQARYQEQLKAAGTEYGQDIATATNPLNALINQPGIEASMGAYTGALGSVNPLDQMVDPTQFSQTARNPMDDIAKYLDPSIQAQITSAIKGVEESAANRGNLFGGSTGQAISETSRGMAERGFNDAFAKSAAQIAAENQAQGANLQGALSGASQNANLGQMRIQNLGTQYETMRNPLDVMMGVNTQMAGQKYGAATGAAGQGYQYGMDAAQQPSTWEQMLGITKQLSGSALKGGL